MALLDRLRPKPEWKHPDPAVRAEAVRRLGAQERDLLVAILHEDADPRVRRAAVKKLSDPSLLAEAASGDGDAGVREEAVEMLVFLALHAKDGSTAASAVAGLTEPRHLAAVAKAAPLDSARQAALARLAEPRALAAVAREAQDPAIRLAAVAQIEDGPTLAALALKCEHKAVALAAVERVAEANALRTIATRARVGAAARRAQARLEEHGHEAAPVPAAVDAPAVAGADDARTEDERRQAEDEREYARAARIKLCETVEAATAGAIPQELDQAREAWTRLAPLAGTEGQAFEERFANAAEAARLRHEAWAAGEAEQQRLEQICAEAEQAAGIEDLGEAKARWTALQKQWAHRAPSDPELRARFDQTSTRLRQREAEAREARVKQEKGNLGRMLSLCARLESLVRAESPTLREVDRGLREAKEALEGLGPLPSRHDRDAVSIRLEAARKALYPVVQQLRADTEWKRWANVGVQEELCGRVEALRQETNLEKAAYTLHELDLLWKQAAEAPKEKGEALWHRFKTARDEVRERCDAFFAKRDAEQAGNLKRKEELCERAEARAESTDWLRTTEEIKKLQAEWKQIGPVPRAKAQAIWERFRRPCDRFFRRRQESRQQRNEGWAKNLERKEAVCVQVESLMDSTDWDRTAAEIKRLQAEWKTIGAVRKSKSEAVWQRFRKAGDHFFERYKQRDAIALAALLEEREALCRELEALAPPGEAAEPPSPPQDLAARLQALQSRWRQPGPPSPAQTQALAARFAQARDRLVAVYPQSFRGTELDPEVNRKKAERLCARVEGLLAELGPAGAADPGADLAERLRNALAANTIGGHAAVEARWHTATEDVRAAQATWKRLGPIPGEAGRELAGRFERACQRFFARRPAPAR